MGFVQRTRQIRTVHENPSVQFYCCVLLQPPPRNGRLYIYMVFDFNFTIRTLSHQTFLHSIKSHGHLPFVKHNEKLWRNGHIKTSLLQSFQFGEWPFIWAKNNKKIFFYCRTLYANVPFVFCMFTLPWIVGMVIYSTYIKCDPLEDGYITKYDEILPFFVHDKLMYIPGCLGLFMATLFNGALW